MTEPARGSYISEVDPVAFPGAPGTRMPTAPSAQTTGQTPAMESAVERNERLKATGAEVVDRFLDEASPEDRAELEGAAFEAVLLRQPTNRFAEAFAAEEAARAGKVP